MALLFQLVSVILVLLAPALTHCTKLVLPVDCSDILYNDKSQPSGVYTICPTETASAVQVHLAVSGTMVKHLADKVLASAGQTLLQYSQ